MKSNQTFQSKTKPRFCFTSISICKLDNIKGFKQKLIREWSIFLLMQLNLLSSQGLNNSDHVQTKTKPMRCKLSPVILIVSFFIFQLSFLYFFTIRPNLIPIHSQVSQSFIVNRPIHLDVLHYINSSLGNIKGPSRVRRGIENE